MDGQELESTKPAATPSRSRGKLVALAAATVVVLYLTYLLVQPFIPPIVWAVTAAVVTHRFSQWVGRKVKSPDAKASICVAVVAVVILMPAVLVITVGTQQVAKAIKGWPDTQKNLNAKLEQHPRLNKVWQDFDMSEEAPQLIDRLQPSAVAAVSTPLYLLVQTLLTLFVLYFLYRDEDLAVDSVRSILPLNEAESNRLFRRVDDTINATMFGTVTVAMVQGIMGGIMFAILGIEGAVLWALIMGLLAIIPYLGTFVIWGPAAAFLAMQGEYVKAAILVGWGAIAIGLIDNLLYPFLVGQRLRQHTVVSFIAILGGVSLFGATGIVLGPVVVTLTFFLLDLWRRRTDGHGDLVVTA